MKRWDYNTLKGEVAMFMLFLMFIIVEGIGISYIFFFADIVCMDIAEEIKSPESAILLTWISRIVTMLYLVIIAKGFHLYWKKQGGI